MGMYATFNAVSDANISAILKTPQLIGGIVFKDDPDIFWEDDSAKTTFIGRLFGKRPASVAPATRPRLTLTENEHNEVDIDKAWHGIHYCLTQDIGEGSHPLGFILYGGSLAGNIDVGYGPARLFTHSETAAINTMLEKVTSDDLKNNYKPENMDDVYPSVIWARTDEDNFEYIDEYFSILKKFISACVRDGLGMATHIG